MSPDKASSRTRRHALIAAGLTLAAVAIALVTSPAWQRRATPVSAASAPASAPATASSSPTVPAPSSIGSLDEPQSESVSGTKLHLAGWALDPSGVAGVDVRIDGRSYPARYGVARDDVGKLKPGYPDTAAPGFEFEGDFGPLTSERHEVEIVVRSRAGGETVLARRSLIPPEAMRLWSGLLDADPRLAKPPFRFLMMTSGVPGGATDADSAYTTYLSRTQQIGIAVPILYLRTTKGAAGDWVFDPNFDLTRKCERYQVAEDNLNGVIQYSIEKKMPVHFILNGGIWADATCDIPEWDVNDHLEQDVANCQWTQDNIVFPDDYTKNLVGSTDSPQLGRTLTYNVYATKVRHYKRRNLQAAARIIAAFGREHPDLFVGVNLDSDTYMNPFFMYKEWFDYNPGMLKQFRHWLAGTGPYAGEREPDVPDLRSYRRKDPLTLADVNRIARKHWSSWSEVEPPRKFPGFRGVPVQPGEPIVWDDPWYQEWETFRKHIVGLHYDELSEWVHSAGIPKDKIFSAQGFLAPEPDQKPFAIYITSRGQNYDSSGVSIEGSIPRAGHLGAVIYGETAENKSKMEGPHSLFATFARMDPGWAVVETNATNLKHAMTLPTYAQSYHAFRDMFNFDASQISLMAWNGSDGRFVGQPGYQPWTAWRNTLAEGAMRNFLVTHADLPRGARLWTFGGPSYADDDGWRLEHGALQASGGHLDLALDSGAAALLSPPDQVIRTTTIGSLILGVHDRELLESMQAYARLDQNSPWVAVTPALAAAAVEKTAAGLRVALDWPAAWRAEAAIATQLKIDLRFRAGVQSARIDRVGLYPATRAAKGAARAAR